MEIAHALLGCMVVPVQAALGVVHVIPQEVPSGASPVPVPLSITAMEDMTSREAQSRGN